MVIKKENVNVVRVSMQCEMCHGGEMIATGLESAHMYQHKCNTCESVKFYTVQYPYLEAENDSYEEG